MKKKGLRKAIHLWFLKANEMYGWDSYFESVGLLIDEKFNLVKG
jgi:hypothetical protein